MPFYGIFYFLFPLRDFEKSQNDRSWELLIFLDIFTEILPEVYKIYEKN